jgi:hypothetical protein
MNVVRNLWKDMVDKRLWPVAVVLVIALVAIPVVLAKPAPQSAPAPASVASSSGPAPMVASPASIRSNTGGALVFGKFRDPFKQQHVSKPAKVTDSSSSKSDAGSGGGESKSSGGGGSSGSSGSSGSPGSSGSGGGSSDEPTVTRLKVRFGLAGGKRVVREITAGTPLPAASKPLIVFLEFGRNGDKPAFLVSSDVVKTEGDGVCKPSKAVCSDLELGVGETQFFDVQNGDQYQLDVLDVVND